MIAYIKLHSFIVIVVMATAYDHLVNTTFLMIGNNEGLTRLVIDDGKQGHVCRLMKSGRSPAHRALIDRLLPLMRRNIEIYSILSFKNSNEIQYGISKYLYFGSLDCYQLLIDKSLSLWNFCSKKHQ